MPERGNVCGEVRAEAPDDLVLDAVQARTRFRPKVCGSEGPEGERADALDRIAVPMARSVAA
ncbi:hypothetical protein [Streptomyces roseolus]|uniref:hypothetical protein n=1 Tax=Streptomyces roseolus TaxID=67358 RepID=UPI0036E3F874